MLMLLHFICLIKFQYFEDSRRLHIQLIKAENLGGSTRQADDINPFVKMYVIPGKQYKQSSNIIKKSKNPVFNQDIFFDNLSLAGNITFQMALSLTYCYQIIKAKIH